MSTSPEEPPEDRPVQTEGVPAEEDIEEADVAAQKDDDPEAVANYTEAKSEEAGPASKHG